MTTPEPVPLIHIHEDDWAMRSLHPIAARGEVQADLRTAIEASERNRAPDGAGWTALHLIEAPSIDFTGVDLDGPNLETVLEPLLPRVRRFYATACAGFDPSTRDPYGSYEEDALCFGFDNECYLKADVAQGRIAALWFECLTVRDERREALLAALRAIDMLTPCALVDHWLKVEGPVGDAAFLAGYADRLREQAEGR